jgi:prepilin-type N-terminal cleavage/methylation domain-containing protein
MNMKKTNQFSRAFTLIELLVVIAIIGVLAGFIIGGLGAAKKQQAIKAAKAELTFIENALENYKLKYGSYPPASINSVTNSLYYELSGVTSASGFFITLDGGSKILITGLNSYLTVFGLAGSVNSTHGSGEDIKTAENFLTGLKSTMVGYVGLPKTGPAAVTTPKALITSVRGPDIAWMPMGVANPDMNPIQYIYPGTNNPSSYDLWVELHIGGKTNIVGNWTAK